jgi:L-amino acid N-acyltransferase YncA
MTSNFRLKELNALPKEMREYCDADVPVMTEIFNETADTGANSPVMNPLSVEELGFYLNFYRNDGLPVYVYQRHDEIIGWLSINRFSWGTKACKLTGESSIYVRQKYFGKGIGCRLAQAVVYLGKQYGMENIVSWVMEENYASQAIAVAVGSELWCRMPKIACFGEKRADVLLYGLPLS